MGNCCGSESDPGASSESAIRPGLKGGESIHTGMLRTRTIDVYKKYDTIEVLGQGSMGYVSKVQVKEGEEGGSAFKPVNTKIMKKQNSSSLSERRLNRVDYALKQIQLDKVSTMFLEELHNEIDILKAMVS